MTKPDIPFAQALYDLAREESLSRRILDELTVLEESMGKEPGFVRLLAEPSLGKEARLGILDECFLGRLHPYTLNFLKLLTEKGHIRQFFRCCGQYRACYHRDNGILPVRAVTAVPLSRKQAEKLTALLTKRTGKTVVLDNQVDPQVLGGVRLEYDGKTLDGSIARRLQALRDLLT